jgi:vancomycin resistance protein YoaR
LRNRSATQKRRRGRKRLRVLIAVGSIVALFVLAMLIDSALYYNKVHTGVSISGISMGGLTRDEATAALTRLVEDAKDRPITLSSGDKTWSVTPADVGAKIDVPGAVSAAMEVTRKSNFLVDLGRRFKLYLRGKDIPLQGSVTSALMDKVLSGVAEKLDVPPVDAGLAIEGSKITVVEGQKGLVVDQGTLREQLKALLFTLHATKLPVPMVVKDPAVQVEEYQQALAQAKTMVGSSVVLRSGDRIWSLTPEQIVAYMDFAAEDRDGVSTLVPYLSAKKMGPYFKNIAVAVDSEPVDATFKSDGKQAWVVPGVLGKAVDPVETAKALTAAALKASERIAKVAVTTTEPDRTTQEAEAMGITDNLGGFTTKWEGTADRQTNVRITTEYASDVILAPGEVYDFDKQVGPRTEERGYKLAPGIVGPGTLEDVFGGGICQVSTTLFNAVFFAGLQVLERKNHSIYIEHYPKGRDATVSAGSPNLRFRNDTKHHILIRGSSTGIVTSFNIYGTDEGRTVTYTTSDFYDVVEREVATFSASWLSPGTTVIKLAGQEGKKIDVIRTVTAKDGSVIHKDTFVSTWRMIPQEVQVGTGTTATTKPTSTTGTVKPPTSTTGATRPPTSSTS